MIRILLVSLILSTNAFAQTKVRPATKSSVKSIDAKRPAAPPAPSLTSGVPIFGTGIPEASPTPVPVKTSPWKLVYYGEYQGPSVGNIEIGKTKTPTSGQDYSEWYHFLKVAYGISKNVSLGTVVQGYISTNTDRGWGFYDPRVYTQWSHMIETSDVDMSGKFSVEIPTTDSSRKAGKLFAFRFDENFTLKTALRNWSFTADFRLKPIFYSDPVAGGAGRTDLQIALFPYITVDLTSSTQLLFEGSFDAVHNYSATSFDYRPGDSDYVDIGPIFTINSHMNTNLALRFFVDNISFKAADLFMNVEIAL